MKKRILIGILCIFIVLIPMMVTVIYGCFFDNRYYINGAVPIPLTALLATIVILLIMLIIINK